MLYGLILCRLFDSKWHLIWAEKFTW